jgi:hypothetical protein
MIMKKQLMMAAFACTLLASCSSDESPSVAPTAKDELNIVVGGIGTRALKSAWAANDEISVFVTGTGYTPAVANYKFSGSAWTPSATGVKLTGNTASVFAYYPTMLSLSSLASTGTFTTALPATDNFAAADTPDYLWGTGTSVTNLTPDITNTSTLTMKHSLAKISFVINSDGTYPVVTDGVTKIVLSSAGGKLVTAGTTQVGTGVFAATASAGTAFTYSGTATINAANGSAVTAYALVAPKDYTATGDFLLKLTIDGKEMTVSGFPTTPNWSDVSKNYMYTITVSPTGLVVANTVTITDWTASTVSGLTAN